MLSGLCHAQSATPDQEYQKLIQVDQNIEPLGEHPFGENINLYDGSFEFDVTDVNLRGNGPAITVGRTMKFWEWINTGVIGPQRPFANWDLDIPRIETIVSQANLWQTGGFPLATQGTTQRCTNFKPPPGVSPPGTGTTGYSADDFWYGYHLLMPGQGDQVLMPRVSANSLSPTISGATFSIVTKNNWMIGCGVTASDGGEGFLAIAPDGTRYTFAHVFYRPANTIAAFGTPFATARRFHVRHADPGSLRQYADLQLRPQFRLSVQHHGKRRPRGGCRLRIRYADDPVGHRQGYQCRVSHLGLQLRHVDGQFTCLDRRAIARW
jgi:hypothetical protein